MAAKGGPSGQAGPARADAAPAGPAQASAGPSDPAAGQTAPAPAVIPRVRSGRALAVATAALVVAVAVGVSVGPADLPLRAVGQALLIRLPWHPGSSVSAVAVTIVWQVRLPRVVLGAIVGAMLAGGGAAYQGVFRNPLADPYLLGVAAGGGLGATAVIVSGASSTLLPVAAFAGAVVAVALTYALGSTTRWDSGPGVVGVRNTSIVLAGVAAAALFTAVQTYLQQQHVATIQEV